MKTRYFCCRQRSEMPFLFGLDIAQCNWSRAWLPGTCLTRHKLPYSSIFKEASNRQFPTFIGASRNSIQRRICPLLITDLHLLRFLIILTCPSCHNLHLYRVDLPVAFQLAFQVDSPSVCIILTCTVANAPAGTEADHGLCCCFISFLTLKDSDV